jgi:hypothetical protein
MNSVLWSEEWQKFNSLMWNVKPEMLDYAPRGTDGPHLRALVYRDAQGKILLPRLNEYLPVQFTPTNTNQPFRITRQWQECAELLIDEMLSSGIRGQVTFSPNLMDPRMWQWAGFRVSPRFTFILPLPFNIAEADASVRKSVNKAQRAGFTVRPADNVQHVLDCLAGTEERKQFSHKLDLKTLELVCKTVNSQMICPYVCYSPDGEPASARIVMRHPGGTAFGWVAGTKPKYLTSGATQLVINTALNDAANAGCIEYDFSCANIPGVAEAKMNFGGRLVTYYCVEGYDYIPIRRMLGSCVRLFKNRREVRRKPAETKAAPSQTAML